MVDTGCLFALFSGQFLFISQMIIMTMIGNVVMLVRFAEAAIY